MKDFLGGAACALLIAWIVLAAMSPSSSDLERACRHHYGVQQFVDWQVPPTNTPKVVCRDGTVYRP